jgi:epoxyqueuosine reductase QueG
MGNVRVKLQIRDLALNLGACAFGVCEVGELVEKFHPEIREHARGLPYAISIGIELQKAVMETIVDRPTEIYKAHYRAANACLDDITFRLAQAISKMGARAIPIPASKVLSRYPMIGHVNHREIAYKAGLGWQGKNNLLVHPVYGGRIRLASLLTDLELEPDDILDADCGICKACVSKCPAGAIGESPEEFDLEKCRDQVTFFSRDNNFGHLICGLCLNRCPGFNHGRKKQEH